MMKEKLIMCLILLSFLIVSCNNKRLPEENEYIKVQKIYNKKGMNGFCKYLKKNLYIAVKDDTQNEATPLLIAIKDGNFENVKFFLEKGASELEKDVHGNGMLDYALENSNLELLNFVIETLPNMFWNNADSNECLPFVKVIIKCSDFSTIQKCIDLTDDINHPDKNGKTPLMNAAQYNTDVRIVKYLLDKGAKIDIKNSNEWSALMYSARYNPNPVVMEDLLLRGASYKPNSVGLTITMLASCNPNPGVFLTLQKYINEINSVTDKGKSALMYACENNQNANIIKILIDNGSDINAKDSNGKTVHEYMSANTSLTIGDIGILWKSLEEKAVEKTLVEGLIEKGNESLEEKNNTDKSEYDFTNQELGEEL